MRRLCFTCVQWRLHNTRVLPRVVTNAVFLCCIRLPMAVRPPPQQYPDMDGVPNIIRQFVYGLLEHKCPLKSFIHCWIKIFNLVVVTSIQVSGAQCYIWFTEFKQKQWQLLYDLYMTLTKDSCVENILYF